MKIIRTERERAQFVELVLNSRLPLMVECEDAPKRITDARRARIHIILRELASYHGYDADGFKKLVKEGKVPGVVWPVTIQEGALGAVEIPVPTMKLSKEDAERIEIQLEAFASETDTPITARDNWHG